MDHVLASPALIEVEDRPRWLTGKDERNCAVMLYATDNPSDLDGLSQLEEIDRATRVPWTVHCNHEAHGVNQDGAPHPA